MYNNGTDKERTLRRALLRLIKAADVVFVTIPFAVIWYRFYAESLYDPFFRRGNYLVIFMMLVIYFLISHLYSGYTVHVSRISDLIYSQALAALITDGIMFFVIWLLDRAFPAIGPMALVFLLQVCVITIWSYAVHKWYFRTHPPKKTVVIWTGLRTGMEQLISRYGMSSHFEVTHTPTSEECIANDFADLSEAEVVFLCGVPSHERNIIVKQCMYRGINVYVIPRIGDVIMSGAGKMHLFHLPVLHLERYNPTPEYLFMKRLLDIVLSGAALILLSPVMLVTAAAIKATDGGAVLYRQIRLTKDGREFAVLKFRSMRMDAEKDGVARLSSGENDPRITPVGRLIRKVRIDELPQLFNILKGDMAIVGPRPERPEIARQYEEELPEFRLRLQAKCGLTGYAQVYGQYNTEPYDKLLMDLMYIAHPSIVEDLKIIFATIKILFLPESTEGVEAGETTAMKKMPH